MQGGSGGGAAPPGGYTYTVISYYSISRYTGYTKMVGPSVFPDSRVLKMLGPSVFPDSQVLQMLGPSVFPDSQVEKSGFETQNGLLTTDFKSETTSKYILDIP